MSTRDVEPHLYPTVIREMIRHENDVTNHRIMWLLIGQGLIANAYVGAGSERADVVGIVAPVGILVTLSAFVILYKSYQARGYLDFLGSRAKGGDLVEADLPIMGWPPKRIKGWRKKVWVSPWLGKASHLLEPYLFLPTLVNIAWVFVLLQHRVKLGTAMLLAAATIVVILTTFALCVLWVGSQKKDEQ